MTKQPAKKRRTSKKIAKPYEPTEKEQATLDAFKIKRTKAPPVPAIKFEDNGGTPNLTFDHPDSPTGFSLLMEAVGTTNGNFMSCFLSQLTNAGTKGPDPDPESTNFMLSVITGIEPKDQMEAMLAAQMAAVHMATMTFARRLNHVDNIEQQNSAERAFNKLARTYTTQMESLKKYRTGGEQKMTVEHVHVHEGGQAIVGNVQGGGGKKNNGK